MSEDTSFKDQEEDLSEYKDSKAVVTRWLRELDLVKNSKAQKGFERVGDRIVKDYKNASSMTANEVSGSQGRWMFNVLWANVQVLKPSLYSRLPKVVVERRFKDSDPAGRLAAEICERATTCMIDTQQDRFNYAIRSAVEDRLLPGRGQVWLRYDVEFIPETDENGEVIEDEDGNPRQVVKPNSEKVIIDPLNWMDYFHSTARNPYEMRWQARRVYMTREQLKKRFGALGKEVELGGSTGELKKKDLTDEERQFLLQAEVWEIWDGEAKRRIWISEGYKEAPLDVKSDDLKLSEFYPCPVPLLATTTTDSMYPTPDFKIYEALAREYEKTTRRISAMVDCVKLVGAMSKQFQQDIKNILKLSDGECWPVDWTNFTEKGGFKGLIDWLPFDQCVNAIPILMQQQGATLSQIFEITGIPDIVRGSTNPHETLGAQQQKGHWTVVKLSEKQADVQRFCREVISRVAQIIFEPGLFSDETISLLCGYEQLPPEKQQLYPQALQLLRDDRLRSFRVGIETDSTIALDEDQEKTSRMEYLATIGQLLQHIQGAMQFRPEVVKPIIESALFAARAFRTGRPLEGSWEAAMQQIEANDAAAAANPPQQPPDYEGQKLQIESQRLQLESDRNQFTQWIESQRLQADGQLSQAKLQLDSQRVEIEAAKVGNKQQVDLLEQQLKEFVAQYESFIASQKIQLQAMVEKEKLITEMRLQQEDREKHGGGGGGGPQLQLHVKADGLVDNRKKKRVAKIMRLPTGELVGESTEFSVNEDDSPADSPKKTVTKMSRGPDGQMVGESIDVTDSGGING